MAVNCVRISIYPGLASAESLFPGNYNWFSPFSVRRARFLKTYSRSSWLAVYRCWCHPQIWGTLYRSPDCSMVARVESLRCCSAKSSPNDLSSSGSVWSWSNKTVSSTSCRSVQPLSMTLLVVTVLVHPDIAGFVTSRRRWSVVFLFRCKTLISNLANVSSHRSN